MRRWQSAVSQAELLLQMGSFRGYRSLLFKFPVFSLPFNIFTA